ncbi:peptidoglycan-binding domain-containing protein [Streptomyces sp. NPDC055099]
MSRLLSRTNAVVSAGVLTAGLVVGVAGTQSASGASYPTCNGRKNVSTGPSAYLSQPYYTATGSRNCTLQYGNASKAVNALQHALVYCYDESISIDGIFGSDTRAALRRTQSAVNVSVDGIYGPQTRKAMKWYVHNGSGSSICSTSAG